MDNGSTTFPKPREVKEAVLSALENLSSANRSVAPSSLAASRLLVTARGMLASLFGVSSGRQIAFTSGATESLNLVIESLCGPGDHVLTTVTEHNSVLRPLARRRAQGLDFDCIGLDQGLGLDLEEAERKRTSRTKVLILNHASNVTGRVNDLARWGDWAKEHGLVFVVDASQSAGLIPIDMKGSKVDVLCCSGHKSLYGPQGVGCIAVREGLSLKAWKVGGSGMASSALEHPTDMPERLEAGTYNTHSIAGLLAGIRYLGEVGQARVWAHGLQLRTRLIEGVASVPGLQCIDPNPGDCVPVVSCIHHSIDPQELASQLALRFGVVGRSGLHCAPLMHRALGTFEQGGTLRFSFSHFNSPEHVDMALTGLEQICRKIEVQ